MIIIDGNEMDDGVDEPEYPRETNDVLGDEGCLFPGQCCMPGPHYTSECHTPEMLMALETPDAKTPNDQAHPQPGAAVVERKTNMKNPTDSERTGTPAVAVQRLVGPRLGNIIIHLIEKRRKCQPRISLAAFKNLVCQPERCCHVLWILLLVILPAGIQAAPILCERPNMVNSLPNNWNALGEKNINILSSLIKRGTHVGGRCFELVSTVSTPTPPSHRESDTSRNESANNAGDDVAHKWWWCLIQYPAMGAAFLLGWFGLDKYFMWRISKRKWPNGSS